MLGIEHGQALDHVVERGIEMLLMLLEQVMLLCELGVLCLQLLVALPERLVVAPQLAFDLALGLGVDERGADGRKHDEHGNAGDADRQAHAVHE